MMGGATPPEYQHFQPFRLSLQSIKFFKRASLSCAIALRNTMIRLVGKITRKVRRSKNSPFTGGKKP